MTKFALMPNKITVGNVNGLQICGEHGLVQLIVIVHKDQKHIVLTSNGERLYVNHDSFEHTAVNRLDILDD